MQLIPLYVRVSMGAGELFWLVVGAFILGVLVGMAAQYRRGQK